MLSAPDDELETAYTRLDDLVDSDTMTVSTDGAESVDSILAGRGELSVKGLVRCDKRGSRTADTAALHHHRRPTAVRA